MALTKITTNKNWKAERKAELRSKLICASIMAGLVVFDVVIIGLNISKTKNTDEPTTTTENYVNMDEVVGFEANGNSLYLHLSDGTGYYYESETETVKCSIINQKYCDDGTDFSVKMPNGEVHVFHTYDTVDSDAKIVRFKVASENKNDYTQYEIVSFE